AVHGQDLLVQRVGLGVLTGVEVTVGQLGEARRKLALEPGPTGLEPDRLLELADCLGVPPRVLDDLAQRRDRPRHLGVRPGKVAAEHGKAFADLPLGVVVVTALAGKLTVRDERATHVWMVRAERRPPELEGASEERLRLVQPAQVRGDATERL